jgi:hypothetical protein
MHHQRYMPSNMLTMQRRSHMPSSLLSPFSMLNSSIPKSTHVPVQFEMFVRNIAEPPVSGPLHSFTTLRKSNAKLADIQMNDTAQLLQTLPQLHSVGIEEVYGTQIIMAESTLKLMSGSLPKTAELGIQFELQSFCNLEEYEDFKCSTRFFEDGKPVDQAMEGPIDYDQHYKRLGNVQFGSRFWAAKVIEMARRLREAHEYRKEARRCDGRQDANSAEDAARAIDFEIRAHFLRLTALQELTAKQRSTGQKATILLVCWKFEQTTRDSRGETTWRNVTLLPSPRYSAHEEALQAKSEFDQLALSLSQHDTTMTLQAPFEAQHSFDLNDLSAMALTGLPSDHNNVAQMYQANDIDFMGGHIHMCLAPEVNMATTAMIDPFTGTSLDVRSQTMYDDSQQWTQQPSYSDSYFSQSDGYHAMRSFEDDNRIHHNHDVTTPFDENQGHTGSPFDGQEGNRHVDASASFHPRADHGFDAAEAVGAGNAEQALPSVEFGVGAI